MRRVSFLFWLMIFCGFYFCNCYAVENFQVLAPGLAVKITTQVAGDNEILVSVLDAESNPVKGLKAEDFVVQRGLQKARILSVDSLETSREVGLNIVLLVDNSYSMKERRAVKPLLSALREFLNILRPIDNVYVAVFDEDHTIKVKGHSLHVKTFHSNDVSELWNFFQKSFAGGLTNRTFLYEGMVAGLDLIREIPEKSNKFLVVFSDGEDLNSTFGNSVVEDEAKGIANLLAYAIDYMPAPTLNPFLKSFAETYGGKIWKASSAGELLPIFRAFSSTLLHRYVIKYRFPNPPRGTLTIEPAELNLNLLTMTNGSPLLNYVFFETGKSEIPSEYNLFEDRARTQNFAPEVLKTSLDRYYNILNIVGKRLSQNPMARVRIVGCNSDLGIEKDNLDLSRRRAEAVKSYLYKVWGIDALRIKVEPRNLPAQATPMSVLGGRAENQRVEIIYDLMALQADVADEFITEADNIKSIKIRPRITAEYGLAYWELTIFGDDQPVKTLTGTGELEPVYTFSLDELGREKLAKFSDLKAHIKLVDIYDDTHEATTELCPIKVSKKAVIHELIGPPCGSLAMDLDKIVIEEVTTIDSSPLLNYVFFDTGESTLSERYTLFMDKTDTKTFAEHKLRGTVDKYYQTLNIIGKRLKEHPEVCIRIVGCNAHHGVERGNLDLSRRRAEAVRSYLGNIWGIESSRMDIEVRNLPAVPSTNRVKEGRAENQRVEVYTDQPVLLDTIKSTFVEEMSDTEQIRILPKIQAGYGIAHWAIQVIGDNMPIGFLNGRGDMAPAYFFDLKDIGLHEMSAYQNITASMEVIDEKGQTLKTATAPIPVKFIKRQERVAQKIGYRVLEKYALILFDFDQAEIKERNKVVLDRIVERIKELPAAKVKIVGHTDTIGEEDYNQKLSERRAQAVYNQILAAGVEAGDKISYEGVGPRNPLYDNSLPEGRALNRTVTISLEYEEKE